MVPLSRSTDADPLFASRRKGPSDQVLVATKYEKHALLLCPPHVVTESHAVASAAVPTKLSGRLAGFLHVLP